MRSFPPNDFFFLHQCYCYPPQFPHYPFNWVKTERLKSVLFPLHSFCYPSHSSFTAFFLSLLSSDTCWMSRWSTPSYPLLRRSPPLHWWWLCRRREHHLSLLPHGSDTCLWRGKWQKSRYYKAKANVIRGLSWLTLKQRVSWLNVCTVVWSWDISLLSTILHVF